MLNLGLLLLGAALLVSVSLNVGQWYFGFRRERELLDRLMARDFGEFKALGAAVHSKPKRFSMLTDEQMAQLEASRRQG